MLVSGPIDQGQEFLAEFVPDQDPEGMVVCLVAQELVAEWIPERSNFLSRALQLIHRLGIGKAQQEQFLHQHYPLIHYPLV